MEHVHVVNFWGLLMYSPLSQNGYDGAIAEYGIE